MIDLDRRVKKSLTFTRTYYILYIYKNFAYINLIILITTLEGTSYYPHFMYGKTEAHKIAGDLTKIT